ncbi:MAG: AmmeMemoRadiSam system radical SAM enzyme [Candidatus Bipolaricaulota bacterium]|nr:AmmeMemoRadiSam system radical SAM enzyme [Candidatus Bipolaricaulota bacterium]MDW8127126.1 AmmeMemoRadiSam system radical SAM enzyme [Candidatus Bipolaricaulota bacterium]
MKEAMLWESLGEGRVRCRLCAHRCTISSGNRGICGVRENREGKLYSLVYNRIVSQALDPVEKKPLFHFLPGTKTLSIATVGCNFRCDFCQNHEISQFPREERRVVGEEVEPEEIVTAAKSSQARSISYTYTEPTVFFELCYTTGKLAAKENLKNIFVTNGYMTSETLREALGWLHAANVDLKSFSEEFYRRFCGASLQPVLETIGRLWEAGIWVEVTTLVIPGRNDSEEELRWIAEFLVGISPDIPWHISRFVPAYKVWDLPPTPLSTLRKAREIGLCAGLRFVYLGNVPGEGEDTSCPNCGRNLVRRYGFYVLENHIIDGHCPRCGTAIPGIWH